jgi:hypothetical protein
MLVFLLFMRACAGVLRSEEDCRAKGGRGKLAGAFMFMGMQAQVAHM